MQLRAPLRVKLLDAKSVDETSDAFDCVGFTYLTIYLTGNGTVSSGVVTIEEADFNAAAEPVYTGTWSSITTITGGTGLLSNTQTAVHLAEGCYGYVRVRISTVIGGGGTVTAVIRGQ